MSFPFSRTRSRFALPQFELQPLEFSCEGPDAGDLVLDEIAAGIAAAPSVVAFHKPGESIAEICERIDRHLHSTPNAARQADAADELRIALCELRRSLA